MNENMPKTLYVSDLDGTLLNSRAELSEFTVNAINALLEQGMLFSYATARSYSGALKLTRGITQNLPVIVYNGTFVAENSTGKRLLSHRFSDADAQRILKKMTACGVYPTVHAFFDGAERYSYCPQLQSRAMREYNDTRRGDTRERVTDLAGLGMGEIFHFTCIDETDRLLPLYGALKEEFQCLFYIDLYSGERWLEVQPAEATKANAVLALKQLLHCEKVVCFGDGKNDISMFEVSDECYAVANAEPELKELANAVIDGNDADGVAKWLLKNFK